MITRVAVLLACIAHLFASPLSVEQAIEQIKITVISEHLDDVDEEVFTLEPIEEDIPMSDEITNHTLTEESLKNGTDKTSVDHKTNKTVEEISEKDYGKPDKDTVLSQNIKDGDEETFISEIVKESQDLNKTVVEETNLNNVTGIETSHLNDTIENSAKQSEKSRAKRQTEILNLDDIETIVTVKNNRIGTEKKFYFKNQLKVVKDQRYSCKIGYRRDNIVFYHRCVWVGTTDSPVVIRNDTDSDFFNFN